MTIATSSRKGDQRQSHNPLWSRIWCDVDLSSSQQCEQLRTPSVTVTSTFNTSGITRSLRPSVQCIYIKVRDCFDHESKRAISRQSCAQTPFSCTAKMWKTKKTMSPRRQVKNRKANSCSHKASHFCQRLWRKSYQFWKRCCNMSVFQDFDLSPGSTSSEPEKEPCKDSSKKPFSSQERMPASAFIM